MHRTARPALILAALALLLALAACGGARSPGRGAELRVRWVLPQAPGSEFSFLIVVGVIAAYATKLLGVYYLVGAFIAGFIARQLEQQRDALWHTITPPRHP